MPHQSWTGKLAHPACKKDDRAWGGSPVTSRWCGRCSAPFDSRPEDFLVASPAHGHVASSRGPPPGNVEVHIQHASCRHARGCAAGSPVDAANEVLDQNPQGSPPKEVRLIRCAVRGAVGCSVSAESRNSVRRWPASPVQFAGCGPAQVSAARASYVR